MASLSENQIDASYKAAKETYNSYGINTDQVLDKLNDITISIPCWQGDDVTGFEGAEELEGGGIAVTGNYPGRARNWDDLKNDLDFALKMIPGKHKVNVHAIYLNTDNLSAKRNEITKDHFQKWIDWAKEHNIGLDFNGTFFSDAMADDGFTLSHSNQKIRDYWIEHGKRCRDIGEAFGKETGKTCVTNLWIPDGFKDIPADRLSPRLRLKESLDEVFRDKKDPELIRDAVECKLFGIGSESYVVGSHEFYMGYTSQNENIMNCLDVGHFHPTETISDKISSLLTFQDKILLHLSRGVRWDSDHIVVQSDDLYDIMTEINRADAWNRIYTALDFFDATVNRTAAWIVGTRAALKAATAAMLEPASDLKRFEKENDYTSRLAIMDERRNLPFGAVFNKFCLDQGVPVGTSWLNDLKNYEKTVLANRI